MAASVPPSSPPQLPRPSGELEQLRDRLSRLEASQSANGQRLAEQSLRLDALAASKSSPDHLGPFITGIGIASSTTVAVIGFGIVHILSVRRQRRDEFFKRVQECSTLLDRIGREGAKLWRRPDDDKEAAAALDAVQADFDTLIHRLALLKRLRPQLSIDDEVIELRRETLLDIEPPDRKADAARAHRVLKVAQNLGRVLWEQYDRIYG